MAQIIQFSGTQNILPLDLKNSNSLDSFNLGTGNHENELAGPAKGIFTGRLIPVHKYQNDSCL